MDVTKATRLAAYNQALHNALHEHFTGKTTPTIHDAISAIDAMRAVPRPRLRT